MGALEFLGHALFFVIGAVVGASVMYFGGLIADWLEDRKEANK